MAYSESQVRPIQELCEIIDCEHKTAPYVPFSNYLVVRTSNVRDGQLSMKDMKYTSEDAYQEWTQRAVPTEGDILFTREAPAGETCLVPPDINICMGQRMVMLRPKKNKVDSLFLARALSTEKLKHKIKRLSIGSTVSRINIADIKSLFVPAPALPEQKKIARILSTWDKAIATTEQLLANSQQQKKALMQQLLTGKKRLLDKNGVRFSGEWKFATFNEAFQIANKKTAQVKSSSYLESGPVPVVDQGKRLIAGYCNNEVTFNDVPVIVFGDHTRCVKWINFEFCPGADGTQVLKAKPLLDMKFAYYLMSNTEIPNLGYSRHMRELKEKDFKIPVELEEQVAIAKSLTVAEQQYYSLIQKMSCLKQEKKALMQQLLTGKRRVKVDDEAAA